MANRRRKKRQRKIVLIIIIIILLLLAIIFFNKNRINVDDFKLDYSDYKYVATNEETVLYDTNYDEIGKIGKNVELELENNNDNKKYLKFSIANEDYYVNTSSITKIEKMTILDNRYKNYIVFNENIITASQTSFYDENNNLIYKINKSFDLPIIIKEENKYGVEFNNRLLYVMDSDIVNVEENHNTDNTNSSGVGVLNYHAFYDENNKEESANCNTDICHSKSQFKTHLDYFKENNILALKINELEMYVDGEIQLPKSVLITIDDGGRTQIAVDMLKEYKMYATIFLVTSWFDPKDYYTNEYIELHSHSHHLHETGACPVGQGGGIQCLDEKIIQDDLKTSREKLNNTTYFCYPFYEYNDYSIKMLKDAGFTMAFIGESNNSDNLVHVNSDKFRLRRFVIVDYTTLDDFDKYFGQIN